MRNEHLYVRPKPRYLSCAISWNPSRPLKIFAEACLSFMHFIHSFGKCLQSAYCGFGRCFRHRESSSEQKKILVFTEHIFSWVWVEQTINKQVNTSNMRWHL